MFDWLEFHLVDFLGPTVERPAQMHGVFQDTYQFSRFQVKGEQAVRHPVVGQEEIVRWAVAQKCAFLAHFSLYG